MAMKPDEQMTEAQLVLEVGHLRRVIESTVRVVAVLRSSPEMRQHNVVVLRELEAELEQEADRWR